MYMLSLVAVTYGGNLKRERERVGLTLEKFAERLGLKRAGPLSTLENGERLPKGRTISRHAKVLGCTPADLLDGVVTEYDTLRGTTVPAPSRAPVHRLTRTETRALRLLALASDQGQKKALGLLAEVARAFPRQTPTPESGQIVGRTSGATKRTKR